MTKIRADHLTQPYRRIGWVNKVVKEKGYGFIKDNVLGKVFFHRTQLVSADFEDIARGTIVDYEIQESVKGPMARHILVVEDAEPGNEWRT